MTQTPPTYHAPDVRQLRDQELLEAPFPGGRGEELRVFLTPVVYEALCAHAAEDTTVEICGVLVGTSARDAGGAFIRVTDAIRGEAAQNKFAEVTFTHDTWARINAEMDKRFTDSAIVGWYHTHPDFGIFLSDRDRFIQENFFSGAGQIALVIDPIRRTVGAFAWRDGKPALCPHFWVGDRIVLGTAAGEEAPPSRATAPAGAAQTRPVEGAAAAPSRLPLLTQVLAYLALFLLGNLIGGYRSAWERLRVAEGAVAHFGIWQGLRPGLHEALDALENRLVLLSRQVDGLSADHLKHLPDQKGAQDQARRWDEVQRDLAEAARFIDEMDRAFSLSPEERIAVERLVLEKLRSMNDPGDGRTPAVAKPAAPEPSKPKLSK